MPKPTDIRRNANTRVSREEAKMDLSPVPTLPDGLYPFIDKRLPLGYLTMVEAPPALEALFKSQAAANGVDIIRDEPVELRCCSKEYPDATIYWPYGTDRIHMLVPREFASRQA
jgi:hypothetical protein